MKQPCIYILASKKNGTLYTGVTSNLVNRVYEHKMGIYKGFSKKYNCKLLMFYELHPTMHSAITREKQLKAGSRKKKIELIDGMNSEWKDLYYEII